MIIITSAAYIEQELSSEFGHIPPAFLPVGNKRLFLHQRATLPENEHIILTIPEGFIVHAHDETILKTNNIEILEIPVGLTLGGSIVCALDLLDFDNGTIKILHGDTLIRDIAHSQYDIISVSKVQDNYNWGAVYNNLDEEILQSFNESESITKDKYLVANGYFSFSNSNLLVKNIIDADGNFIQGINEYAKQIPVKPIICDSWLDFGHVHTYFRSKSEITTQREFNELDIGLKTVKKSSGKIKKMRAEANWYVSLPCELKPYTPHFISSTNKGYEIEYLYLSSLNELFVFGWLPFFSWKKILYACFEFLEVCDKYNEPTGKDRQTEVSNEYFLTKTNRRLIDFSEQSQINLNDSWLFNGIKVPSLLQIAKEMSEIIPKNTIAKHGVLHGDFCFSNILYDFRTQSVKVIDPRGYNTNEEISIYGNQTYDVAKLAHSIIGLYDFIIAGY